jgi:hypothetical protein
MELYITSSDLHKLATLPLRSDARFNTFLATYARASANKGCAKCRQNNSKQVTVDAINTAGAALKAISTTNKVGLKNVLTKAFNVPENTTIIIKLGPFNFQI